VVEATTAGQLRSFLALSALTLEVIVCSSCLVTCQTTVMNHALVAPAYCVNALAKLCQVMDFMQPAVHGSQGTIIMMPTRLRMHSISVLGWMTTTALLALFSGLLLAKVHCSELWKYM
jgi:hypothetical protein